MESGRYQLFIKEGCAKCQEIVEFMGKSPLNTEVIDVASRNGFELSQKQNIMKLPTVLVLDSKEEAIDRLYTLYELQKTIQELK